MERRLFAIALTLATVVAGMAAGFRRCFNKALAEDPEAAGTLKIRARIGQTEARRRSRSR